jgi:predicted nuclease of predicted toxin-antitoxin system
MLILLDENLLSRKLKQPFLDKGHSVYNVEDMGWRGFKDREILDLAENYPFDAFITADKNLRYQQNLAGKILRVVILDAPSTRPNFLLPLMEQISDIISSLSAGALISINDTGQIK